MAVAYAAGANAYVVKPLDLQRFMTVVRSIEEHWTASVRLPWQPVAVSDSGVVRLRLGGGHHEEPLGQPAGRQPAVLGVELAPLPQPRLEVVHVRGLARVRAQGLDLAWRTGR